MKIWKMAGCLALLCVIICGCVVLGKNTEVSAKEKEEQEAAAPTEGTEVTAPREPAEGGSATAEKTYSTGLYFRSNGDGTCALAGLGSCTASCVLIPPKSPAGDKVTEILPYAFAGSIVGAVEIPTTVETVSAASFAECARLAYVRVAAGNAALCEYDGALYTADGSVLIYCPSGRNARELRLHQGIKRIAAAAFAHCAALDTVCFSGSTAAWHDIIVGDENNALYAAKLVFDQD